MEELNKEISKKLDTEIETNQNQNSEIELKKKEIEILQSQLVTETNQKESSAKIEENFREFEKQKTNRSRINQSPTKRK